MSDRGARLAKLVAERELDQLFVSDLVNVRYLTGFTGTNGACLVGPDARIFFTDFRYTERAEQEVGEGWERPPSWPTTSTSGRSSRASPGAGSGTSPAPSRPASASWAPSRRSPRSSPRGPTAHSRTPSPGTV